MKDLLTMPAPAESAPAESAPTDLAPAESVPTESAPTESAPTESAPAESVPTESAPTDLAPAESAPTESAPAAEAAPASIAAQVESILYATGEPAAISAIAAALDTGIQDIESALAELSRGYASRGVRLQRHANQVQLVTAPEFAERVQRFLGLEAANRLSAAAIETLAIIAYKQPITKPQIEMIRGVNCDGVMKTLELHNLIHELGRAETVGRPMRYGVSFEFWQHFGLSGIHDLPPIDHLDTLPAPEAEADGA